MLIFFVCVFVVLVFGMIIERNEQEKELAKTEQVTPTDTMTMYIEPDTLDYNTITRTIDAEIEIIGVEVAIGVEVDTFTHDNDYIEGNIIIVDRDGSEYNIDSLITIYKKYHAK